MENSELIAMMKKKQIVMVFKEGMSCGLSFPDHLKRKNEKFMSKHFYQIKTITEDQWKLSR